MPETLFASTEGRLLGVGLVMTGLMLLAFGIGGYLFPDSALTYAAITGLNLTIGRAAGMYFFATLCICNMQTAYKNPCPCCVLSYAVCI